MESKIKEGIGAVGEAIIKTNFDKLIHAREHMEESVGGNADTEIVDGTKYSCASYNAFVDKDIGQIIEFTNDESPGGITLRSDIVGVSFDMTEAPIPVPEEMFPLPNFIIRIYGIEKLEPNGRRVLEEFMVRWNAEQGKGTEDD